MPIIKNWTSWISGLFNKTHKPSDTEHPEGKRKYLVTWLMVPPLIAVIIFLFIHRAWLAELDNWGYLGAFLIGLIGNVTVILPMPGLVLLFALAVSFNPLLIGLAGAAGGTIGELSGYLLGYSGTAFIQNNRLYLRAEKLMKKLGSVGIFLFALLPFLHFDLAGIAAGVLRFPIWKFLLACWLGKTILYISLAYTSYWGWDIVQRFL